MSLTERERKEALAELKSPCCPKCKDELQAHDDGMEAYVVCDTCGYSPDNKGDKMNETKTKHTPTPWKFSDYPDNAIVDSGNKVVGRISGLMDRNTIKEAQANARFIVTACNRDHLFWEMLKILQIALIDGVEKGDVAHYQIEALLARIEKEG